MIKKHNVSLGITTLRCMVDCGWMDCDYESQRGYVYRAKEPPNKIDMPDFIRMIHMVACSCDGDRLHFTENGGSYVVKL